MTDEELLFLINEANNRAKALNRNILFELVIINETDEQPGIASPEEGKSTCKVKVDNKEEGYQYWWSQQKFIDRLKIIRDIMNNQVENGKLPKLDKEEDPFWDPRDAILIGRAYLYLKALSYMLSNDCSCKIKNTDDSRDCGVLHCDVKPTDETGEADDCPEELYVDKPEELLGKSIDFNIVIKKADNLPEKLCKDTYVKYSWYFDNQEYQTNICEGVNRDPNFDYKYHMNIDCVTEDLLKYFKDDALCFEVYGTPISETSSE